MINDQCGFERLWSGSWMAVLLIDSALLSIPLADKSALHPGVQRKGGSRPMRHAPCPEDVNS